MPDDYQDCLDALYARLDYERAGMPGAAAELKLGRMRRLLRRLGEPQDAAAIVHVAGTKGKGSTSAMVAAALSASGRRTGLSGSPHLHRLEERFVVDGRAATADELVALHGAVLPAVLDLDAEAARIGERTLTFFEVTTAMALLHFARRGAEAVVLEVGMGGRLDSTNVVRPAVSVLTSISLDHTRQLGATAARIAAEKAGILKRGRPAVSGVRGAEAVAAIRRVAAPRRSRLRELDVDFSYTYRPEPPPLGRPAAGTVEVRTWRRDWGALPLPLFGPHQAANAAVALATLDVLAELGLDVGPEAVSRGFAGLSLPARVEVLEGSPTLVIDGAHNVASAEALAETLRACFPPSPRVLVFGTTREKDLPGQLRALLPSFDHAIATRYAENPRSVPVDEVASAMSALGVSPHVAADPASALATARRLAGRDALICVTGSLFLAAETRALVLGLPPTPAAGRVAR